MSIYGLSGTQLSSAYGRNGESLSYAYNVNGVEVFSAEKRIDYDNYSVETLYSVSGITSHTQGFAIYNEKIFAFKADDQMYTFNLSNGTKIAGPIACSSAHGGSASFGDEFYETGDAYPLLYVSSDNNPSDIYVNRVTTASSELVRTLLLPLASAGYYVKATVDGEILYALGYTENSYTANTGTNNVIVSKWDLNNLSDNGDGTYTPRLISSFERPFIYVLQFATFHDGMIWAGSGYGSPRKSNVYAINPNTGAILHTITLPDTVEIEGGAFVLDENEHYYLVVLQWGGKFLKYTFQYV